MKDLMGVMKQLGEMQSRMQRMQEELAQMEIDGQALRDDRELPVRHHVPSNPGRFRQTPHDDIAKTARRGGIPPIG